MLLIAFNFTADVLRAFISIRGILTFSRLLLIVFIFVKKLTELIGKPRSLSSA